MTIGEKLYFVRQLRAAFSSIGAVIPTSRYAAAAMAAEVARRPSPKTVLEVGPGTGSITAEIIRHLGPDDELVLCEINPGFVAYLRKRFGQEPAFQAVRNRVTIYELSVTDLPSDQQFDCIVSAVPFTSLPFAVTEAIIERYHQLLRPGGTLTYIEYAGLRALKSVFSGAAARERTATINQLLDTTIARHQFRRDLVWANMPPAWIRHLRLVAPQTEDLATIAPLEYTNKLPLTLLPIASDATTFIGPLLAVALLLQRVERKTLFLLRPSSFILLLVGLIAAFFRDPPRRVQVDPTLAYAACDGRVLSVEQLSDERLGEGQWLRIAVFLSLLDVHINRAPVAGVVRAILHEAGGYAPADSADAEHNVAQYTMIDGVYGPCVVTQRSGLVARRIVNRCRVGEAVAQGERYGLIRFGSRTDVYLPADAWQPAVQPGNRVTGGETVLARRAV